DQAVLTSLALCRSDLRMPEAWARLSEGLAMLERDADSRQAFEQAVQQASLGYRIPHFDSWQVSPTRPN
ncbi:MAG: hypothetical protein MI861_20185, partial [Pirellulales bacterium]|nr:hypothetical protein [Pirellulales bacterium]